MRKDNSVKKAEWKAALTARLNSLIVPVIFFLLILAGVLVIVFWNNAAKEEEIVKVHAYDGDEKEIILENDYLEFNLDSATTQFSVTVKSTGKVWYSNPQDMDRDTIALASDKDKLKSTLLLTYSTQNGVDTLLNNYTYSMLNQIYNIEAGEDFIKIYYSIGDTEKEYTIPSVITQERMEYYLSNMSNVDANTVRDYYKKYDIDHLGKKDNKEKLLATYPILADEIIYVIRDTTRDNLKSKFETYFAEAGYTEEDYIEDKGLDLSAAASDKPVFNVNVIYRLEDEDLIIEVPMEEIEYREDYPLLTLSPIPYFGAGGVNEEGFMLVPEGGGAIINFNNGKIAQNSYYANVYGWDMAQGRTSLVHDTSINYGVYGISSADNSFLCILEKDAANAAISADISGRYNNYNYANATYNILHREQFDVAEIYNGEMYVYEKSPAKESIVQRIRFVDSGDYVDMAHAYYSYLCNTFGNELTLKEDTDVPVAVEILGAVDKVEQIAGIPVSKPLKLTSYKEALELLEYLKEAGMNNMSVKLSGWMNGGIRQSVLTSVDLVSRLGSKKDLKSLLSYTGDNGIDLYLDGITNYAYDNSIFDGFLVARDAARLVTKEKAELFEYSSVWYGVDENKDSYYLLKPSLIVKMMEKLADTAAGYGAAGVSFRDIGNELSADYNEDRLVTRQAAQDMQLEVLKKIEHKGLKIMINKGNDYAIPYTDFITDMDFGGSHYSIIDNEVPFYQIAIHGLINYSGEALNLSGNYEEELLNSAEYGAGLYFVFMNSSAKELQDTYYTKYYGADYKAWAGKMKEIYTKYESSLAHVYHQRIVDHDRLDAKITCTVYEDGTKVYVNYSYNNYTTADGIIISARDYVVMK